MLAAIRDHLATSKPFDAVRSEHHGNAGGTPIGSAVAVLEEQGASLVERFQQAVESVAGRCVVVPDETEAAELMQLIIEQKNARRIAVTNSPLVQRVVKRVKLDVELLENVVPPALFDCDIGITSAQWAVAETGTLVLESDKEQHRLASLVPPVHIAIIEADQIRHTLAEVLQALSKHGQDTLSRTVTFVTGPSRTSDIELTLAISVHGPAELYVIVLR